MTVCPEELDRRDQPLFKELLVGNWACVPGRSGLDLGLGMSYNSLVWTKSGSEMHFDVDQANISPGFRLGFPVVEAPYYNDSTSKWAFLMVTPSGGRIEFRQTGASDTYETADSSYTMLKIKTGAITDPVETLPLIVTTTDGTAMSYEWKGGAYRCSKIKDRNGNYITITHDADGTLRTMTDTLGRVVTVNYDAQLYPTSITQVWKTSNGSGSDTTHTWASFAYTTKTVSTDFGSLTVIGPPNDTTVKVLEKVTYPDGSYTKFTHNGYIQVQKVESYAADNHLLNHVRTNLDSVSGTQSDCPRFTATYSKAENFNLNGSGVPQEIEVTNSITTGSSYSLPNSISGSATRIDVTVTGHPGGLYSRTYVGESGWKEGLPLATEDCTGTNCSDRKRWSWTDWTQDDTGLSYILNPRVIETRVGDGTNTKKSQIEYRIVSGTTTVAEYGLVKEARVYASDLSTVIKKVATEYNLDSAYTSRRIIGLPSQTEAWGKNDVTGNLEYVSKVTYAYDAGTLDDSSLQQSISPTQHDSTNYGSSFVTGRGNLTSTRRWNIEYPTTESQSVVSSVKYNTAGSVVSQTDPRGRVSKIFYSDDWNDSVSRTTYAYPTTVTDPAGQSSVVEYRFDLGANVWARSPTPSGSGNTYGKTTSREYKAGTGQIEKEKILNTGAYTRYDYPNTGIEVKTYSTIVDITGVGTIDSSDEVLTETQLDGAGRVRRTRTENPNSTGTYTGKLVEYDILGRTKRETVPTEINSSWNPAGDDYRGMDGSNYIWLWNTREFDWMGRVTREINTDGTDKLFTYAGCGCAGGLVTTVKGEVSDAVDVAGNMQTTKRRTQKIYEDILGRSFKTEIWDLDGSGSAPYSTTVTSFNGRDQVILARQYSGSDSSSTYQDTTATFDGHGRLKTSHKPENRDSSNNLTYTTFNYNADDTISDVTDPRGAVTAYKYGNIDDSTSEYRALLTKVLYTSPDTSVIPDPADVVFTYDNAGNRLSMNDGTGSLSYSYDELSRLKTETKDFTDYLEDAPSGVYTLTYSYTLTGGIKSITDPFGAQVAYTTDKIGRTTAIGNGTDPNEFAKSIAYRAFGGVKSMIYSTTEETNISLSYNTRLRPATYESESEANSIDIQNKTYTYLPDGAIKQAADNVESKFGQLYEYDFASRLKKNQFGTGSPSPTPQYKQILGYDAFSNLIGRQTWDKDNTERTFTAGYTNNRKTTGGYGIGTDTHDNAGNVVRNIVSYTPVDERNWKFDAAGRMADWEETSTYVHTTRWDQGATITFDGDGRPAKRESRKRVWASPPTGWSSETEYSIFSSVTGQTIIELNNTGEKSKANIYLGSSIIAEQVGASSPFDFKNIDPITSSGMTTSASGAMPANDGGRLELEPLGSVIPTQEPETSVPHIYAKGGAIASPDYGCVDELTDAPAPCNVVELDQAYERCIWLGKCDEDVSRKKKRRSNLFEEEEEDHKKKNWPDNPFPFDFIFADNKRRDKPGFIPEYVYHGEAMQWNFTGRWIRNFAPHPLPPPPPTDCQQYAAKLAGLIDEYRDKAWALRVKVGDVLSRWAIDDVIANQKFEVSGFKPGLVSGGQKNDIYRHVALAASSVLLDGIGIFSGVDDTRQRANIAAGDRPAEAMASLEGNLAGRRVGFAMADAIRRRLPHDRVKKTIERILCE